MTFDFTNYTFSGFLSILAALYGVGYPLIMQSIERIYTQYDSSLLSARFTRESMYRVFQFLLVVNLLFAVTIPFVLYANCLNKLFITIQAIFLVWLMGQTFLLFRLILTYSNGDSLFHHINKKRIDAQNVMDILDIAIYADSKHNRRLYYECFTDVYAYFTSQLGDKPNQSLDIILPPVIYDQTVINICDRLRNYLSVDDGHHLLYTNGTLVSVLYNQISASRISIQCHRMMWDLVREVVACGNRDWFMQYWQYADSYYNMKYHSVTHGSPLRQDSRLFRMRHTMIGALLVKYKRTEWLNETLFYTHSEPEYYGLVPSTYAEIIQMMNDVDEICQPPHFQNQGFYFDKSLYSVKEEKYFFNEAIRYLALLFIRLWSINVRNHMYFTDVMTCPEPPCHLQSIERDKEMLVILKRYACGWIDTDVYSKIPRLVKPVAQGVFDLIDEYYYKCDNAYKYLLEHPLVDQKKFDILKSSLTEQAKLFDDPFPMYFSIGSDSSKTTIIETDVVDMYSIKTIDYSDTFDIDTHLMPEAFMREFNMAVHRMYIHTIARQKVLARLTVQRSQLAVFLKMLGLTDDDAIIASDAIAELPRVDVQLHTGFYPPFFYIVKCNEQPEVKFMTPQEQGMKRLRDQKYYPVYSNIDEFLYCRNTTFNLKLGSRMKIAIKHNFQYVRVGIDDSTCVQNAVVTINKTLQDFFV